MERIQPIEFLYVLVTISVCVNIWAIRWGYKANIRKVLETPEGLVGLAPSLKVQGSPKDHADKVVARMGRVGIDPESQSAIDKVKRRFPGVIVTDEQALALIQEAIKRAKTAKTKEA